LAALVLLKTAVVFAKATFQTGKEWYQLKLAASAEEDVM
jgi:hypothetical protein